MTCLPYESQWGDLSCNAPLIEHGTNPATYFDWSSDGYPSEAEYLFWSRHICGLACLRPVLRAWTPHQAGIAMYELIQRALQRGALVHAKGTVEGLFYRPFVEWVLEDFAIQGTVHPVIDADELLEYVRDGRVALASVSSEIRYPDRPNKRRGGHLVLIYALEDGYIRMHNPSGVGHTADGATLDLPTFERFFAHRGVTLRKPE